LQDIGSLRDEPGVVPHGEFLEELVRRALTDEVTDGVRLANDWRFPEIERLARLYRGHEFKSPRRVTAQLFSAALDLERALFVVHPQLRSEAVADFWRSIDVREHLDECCESIERTVSSDLPHTHKIYVQALQQMRYLLSDHATRILRCPVISEDPSVPLKTQADVAMQSVTPAQVLTLPKLERETTEPVIGVVDRQNARPLELLGSPEGGSQCVAERPIVGAPDATIATTATAAEQSSGTVKVPTWIDVKTALDRGERRDAVKLWKDARRAAGKEDSHATIYKKSGDDHSEFYKWLRGNLKPNCNVDERVQEALRKLLLA
jgi:hypothetical protein